MKKCNRRDGFGVLLCLAVVGVLCFAVLVGCGNGTETYKFDSIEFDSIENSGAAQADEQTAEYLFRDSVFNFKTDGSCYYRLTNSAWVDDTWSEENGVLTLEDSGFVFRRDGADLILTTDNMSIIFKKS